MRSRELLQHRSFRLLLLTKFLLSSSAQMQAVAVGWQVYALKRDPLYLGLIGLAEALPAIGVALYAGYIVDRHEPRGVYFRASLAFFLGSAGLWIAALPFWNLSTEAHVGAIFAFIFLIGLATGFTEPAHFKLVSQALPREQLKSAAPWTSSAWQIATIAGPAVGGLLYAAVGAAAAYAAVTLLVLGALIAVARIDLPNAITARPTESLRQSLSSGLRFVFGDQIILGALSLDMLAVLFGGATSVLPMYVDIVLHQGPMALGVLRAAPSIGAVIMAALLLRRPVVHRAGPALLFAVAGFGLCMIGFGLSRSFLLSTFLLAVSGALDNVSVMIRYTILQLSAPDEMRGRISAVNNIFLGSSNQIGEFESGVAARVLGLVPSIVLGGSITLLVVGATAWLTPKLRRLDLAELERLPVTTA